MAKQETIQMDYIGDCLSVNHYLGRRKGGGYYVKQETKDWKEQFQWLLNRCHLEDFQLPLEVTCSGWFKDERSAPDLSNLSKVILDSIEELSGINDKDMRWHDGKRVIGEKSPYLIITISESAGMPSSTHKQSVTEVIKNKSGSKLRRLK